LLPLLSLLLPLSARAQDVGAFDGQAVRPSADSLSTIWTDDATIRPGFVGRLGLGYARDPILLVSRSTGKSEALIADLGELDLIVGWAGGPVRAAVLLPLVAASSEVAAGVGGLGDVGLDVKGQLLDPASAALGLAVGARVTAPTATTTLPLGADGPTWDVRLILDKPIGDLRLLGNLGYIGRPEADLGSITGGSALLARLGIGYSLGAGGLSAEAGAAPLVSSLGESTAFPAELLLGGWVRATDTLVIRGSGGTGVTEGIGAARARTLITLDYSPRIDDDIDRDGIPASRDACPLVAEDMDGVEDEDGCPEDATTVDFLVKDPYGGAIVSASVQIVQGEDTQPVSATGRIVLEPGTYRITAEAPAYLRLDDLFTVEANTPLQLVKVMEPDVKPTGRVIVKQDRIEILEKVYFQTGSADLRMESFSLLQEVASILRSHPEVRVVQVEGHTDSRGDDDFNLELSQARSESVVRFLTEHGVAASRLRAKGYGETRPVDERDVEAAWDRNRRVEFVIIERD